MARKRNNALFQNAANIESTKSDCMTQSDVNVMSTTDLQKENIRLIQQNQEYAEKISQYLDEIEKLKDELQQLSCLSPASTTVQDTAIKALQNENDNYLTKISQLTFENARLLASIEELKTSSNSNKNNSQIQSTNVPYFNNTYTYPINNGYKAWN